MKRSNLLFIVSDTRNMAIWQNKDCPDHKLWLHSTIYQQAGLYDGQFPNTLWYTNEKDLKMDFNRVQ